MCRCARLACKQSGKHALFGFALQLGAPFPCEVTPTCPTLCAFRWLLPRMQQPLADQEQVWQQLLLPCCYCARPTEASAIAPCILICSRKHCLARRYWLLSVPGRSLQLTEPQATFKAWLIRCVRLKVESREKATSPPLTMPQACADAHKHLQPPKTQWRKGNVLRITKVCKSGAEVASERFTSHQETET